MQNISNTKVDKKWSVIIICFNEHPRLVTNVLVCLPEGLTSKWRRRDVTTPPPPPPTQMRLITINHLNILPAVLRVVLQYYYGITNLYCATHSAGVGVCTAHSCPRRHYSVRRTSPGSG